MHEARMHRLAVEFNLRPDRYIGADWMPDDWPARYRDLARFGERGRAVLAAALLARWCPGALPGFGFGSRVARIALLDRDALATLGAYCGLMLHRSWLRDASNWRAQSVLVDAFGHSAMPFVLERAPPFDVIGETLEPYRRAPLEAVDAIRRRGCRLLFDLVAAEHAALASRLALKFPRSLAGEPPYGLSVLHRQHLAELIFLCLIPERLAQWDWLF
jgi:type III secretion protein K